MDDTASVEIFAHKHITGFIANSQKKYRYDELSMHAVLGFKLTKFSKTKFLPVVVGDITLPVFGMKWDSGMRDKCIHWANGLYFLFERVFCGFFGEQ